MSTIYSGDGITFPDGVQMTGYPQGWRNRIINGDMRFSQAAGGAAVTTTGAFPVDRFYIVMGAAGKFTAQQNKNSITPPDGFTHYLGIESLSSYSAGAGEIFGVIHRIEGVNVADFGWGTANAKAITISYLVRSSLTGTFGASVQNSGGTRSYPFTYTINAANTWETKTVTLAGDTSGTWLTTTGVGLQLCLDLGTGTTYQGTSGSWAGANYYSSTGATSVVGTNGATFYITGVMLERGAYSGDRPFDYVEYGEQLRRCQRYYYREAPGSSNIPFTGFVSINSGTTGALYTRSPSPMRAATSQLDTGGVAGDFQVVVGSTAYTCSSLPTITTIGPHVLAASLVFASGPSSGQVGFLRCTTSTFAAQIGWSSEL